MFSRKKNKYHTGGSVLLQTHDTGGILLRIIILINLIERTEIMVTSQVFQSLWTDFLFFFFFMFKMRRNVSFFIISLYVIIY